MVTSASFGYYAGQLGWREWVYFQEWGLKVKAKVDTGAATSAIDGFNIERFKKNGKNWIRFDMRPHQHNEKVKRVAARVLSRRSVKNSGGHTQNRYVIEVIATIGMYRFPMELTLTEREKLNFRMLMGRRAMVGLFTVDPSASFVQGRPRMRKVVNLKPQPHKMTSDKHEDRNSLSK